MEVARSKVTSKGQIVIPKRLRKKYGIGPNTRVSWVEREEGLLLVPEKEDPIVAAKGMLAGTGILKAYLLEKQEEKKREAVIRGGELS
ncbi:MAG: AbrB/MazE/SpoVT family DNA-binding domain-containing protein [Deltaproteobacteria bacterium]|nr:MAG: AbrB/MazE/SpoVT family DNA-binding domain-containing protein [Deltaproteobacteria bacterium]